MATIQDAIKRLTYVFSSQGADKVVADNNKVTDAIVSGATTQTRASLSLEKSFDSLERRYVSTIRAQQDYEKVQKTVNAAVAQNPELQDRANVVLASAKEKFDAAKGSADAFSKILEAGRGAALGYAAGIGPIGAVLGSFGPWGIAAAAGIGLVVNALDYMNKKANEIGTESSGLKQFADTTGLTVTQVRGLTEAGAELGIASETVSSSIQKFTFNLADARKGSGSLYDELRVIDRQLADNIASTHDGAEALDILTEAYNSTTDATTKAAIARAAFGKGGAAFGNVLGVVGDAGGVDAYSASVQKALGVTDEWTNKVAALRNENRSLESDLKLISASAYTAEMLERQNTFLKQEISIAKVLQDAKKYFTSGGSGPQTDEFGQPFDFSLLNANKAAKQAADSPAPAASGAIEAAKKATEGLAQAQRDNLDATTRMAAESSALVSALGLAATAAEKEQARIEALTVSFQAGKISAETYGRALNANPAVISAQQMTDQLKQQNDLAAAGIIQLSEKTDLEKAEAQQQATYNQQRIASEQEYQKVLKDTGDKKTAMAAADEKSRSFQPAIATGQDRIADATKATRDAAIEWQQTMLGEGPIAQQLRAAAQATADSYQRAANAAWEMAAGVKAASNADFGAGSAYGASGGFASGGNVPAGKQYTSSGGAPSWTGFGMPMPHYLSDSEYVNNRAESALRSGGSIQSAISSAQGINITDSGGFGAISNLYDLLNKTTGDNAVKEANLRTELAWVESQPSSIARQQQINNLMDSIDQLKNSVDKNTAATLNPLYSQGHGALAIGYYHAASGLDATVRGSGGVDSVPVHMMLTPGERVSVTSGSNDNSSTPASVQNIYMDLRGMDTNTARRSRRQFAQGFGQTAAAMSR